MTHTLPKRILFAGYAPVHFLCFLPVYRRLLGDPRAEVHLSGGLKGGTKESRTYALEGLYEPFGVEPHRLVPVGALANQDYDVLVCAHLSDAFFPRSVGRAVQIYHGVSFKNLAIRERALRYDLLCLPGRYHAERYYESGLVRPGGSTPLITGFPKADALVTGPDPREGVLKRHGLDPRLPSVLFAPTGEKHNALESMGEEVIRQFAAASGFNLLVKPHDHPKNPIDWGARLAPLEGDRVRVVRELDVVPCLRAADVLLTDASSVAVEYTLLDRPIVFLDVPRLFKRVRRRAPALDLETYGRRIGRVVERPADVVKAVCAALEHPEEESEVRQAMARHVFHDPGRAAERVAGVVFHAAGLAPALPEGVERLTLGAAEAAPGGR